MLRPLLIAISAALLGATAYSIVCVIDIKSANTIGQNIKTVIDNPMSIFQKKSTVIAQKYGGTDPHGDDPHGDDPHDEIHDPNLPANKERSFGKAPKDVYGGTVPNSQQPY